MKITTATRMCGVQTELSAIQRRTRRGVATSIVLHALLFVFLKITAPDPTEVESLVEITWVETPAPAPAPAPPPALARLTRESPVGKDSPVKPAVEPERTRFVREMPRSQTAPEPQHRKATRDLVRERLASVTRTAAEARTQIAALLPTTRDTRPVLASAPSERVDDPSPRTLVRGESRTAVPSRLVRANANPASAMTALAQLVDEPVVTSAPPTTSAAVFPPREVLSGVSLAGPVSNRKLMRSSLPAYPDWAKRDGVEGSVQLRFVVRPDGGVREGVLIEKTSGHEDFDRNATIALLDWRFEALPGSTGDQWGSITLDYRLDSLH